MKCFRSPLTGRVISDESRELCEQSATVRDFKRAGASSQQPQSPAVILAVFGSMQDASISYRAGPAEAHLGAARSGPGQSNPADCSAISQPE